MKIQNLLPSLLPFLLLAGCAPAEQAAVEPPHEPVATVVSEPAPALPPPAFETAAVAEFDMTTTLSELMRDMIQPTADTLWMAISYVSTLEGVVETSPETDEDWERLRTAALALIEAGNALMLPGRPVMGEVPANYPQFQYRPDEIEALIAADPESWNRYAQGMQEWTRETLVAIGFRDQMGFSDFSARINDACQGCHAQFWYRGNAMP
jgi:uncharacterized protein YjeT (DUF2065 family)